jgi:hypothetical protein
MKMNGLTYVLCLAMTLTSCGDTIILQGDNPGVISTIAGGSVGIAETGSNALEVNIVRPNQVIGLEMGGVYILETGYSRLLYVDSRGVVERIAGNGEGGFAGEGIDAREALLNAPEGFDIDSQGNIYIADTYNHRIRMIDGSNIIRTVAGSDQLGFSGDGLPATEATLFKPSDVAVDPIGRLFISDLGNHRIRMVDENGIIQTIAGTGNFSFNGEGILAEFANILFPSGIDVDSRGNVYVAVAGHDRVRMIDVDGTRTITTVAGSSSSGFDGDGGLATSASLNYPRDVFLTRIGEGFYIADSDNNRIRFVDFNGIIYTVAGNGEDGYNGDGIFATEASLHYPSGISLDVFNNLYIADTDNFRIRRVPFP